MKQSIILSIILLAIAGVMSGCASGTGTTTDSQTYIGGTGSMQITFLESAPPEEIYDQSELPYSIEVQLQNVGEIDIEPGMYDLELTGINYAEFGLVETPAVAGIDAMIKDANGNQFPGGIVNWKWDSQGYPGQLTSPADFTIWAESCFRYGSKAQAMLCYKDNDMMDTNPDSICKVRASKIVQNAASPIQVASIQEAPQGSNKVSIIVTLQHSGTGDIYNVNTGTGVSCPNEVSKRNRAQVTIETGHPGLSCTFQGQPGTTGEVIFVDGKTVIRCEQLVPEGSNYESLVYVTTLYNYKLKASTNLRVIPIES